LAFARRFSGTFSMSGAREKWIAALRMGASANARARPLTRQVIRQDDIGGFSNGLYSATGLVYRHACRYGSQRTSILSESNPNKNLPTFIHHLLVFPDSSLTVT
jgi:hypothetical protein